jgi:hypothetical protein
VITEPISDPTRRELQGGGVIYGARISQTNKKYYTVGLSALKSEHENGSRYREEEGVDLWLRPLAQVDVTGRSSYNSITNGWMESSYALAYSPLTTLKFGADYSHINFKDYFATVTTSALSLFNQRINPTMNNNQEQDAVGINVAYTGLKNLTIAADYKFYSYTQSGDTAYFGAKASYLFPEAFLVGGSLHRMDGGIDRLRYTEYRAFVTKKISHADLTIDFIDLNYDSRINGIRNTYTVTGAVGYEFNRKLKVGADIEYSRNPDFDSEVRGLLKATYTFDTKLAAEGGTKSEK